MTGRLETGLKWETERQGHRSGSPDSLLFMAGGGSRRVRVALGRYRRQKIAS
jgi:hypothetical protein